jgi:surface protein
MGLRIKIKDKAHLQSVIEEAIRMHGPTVNLNHLDVSSVTDMSLLFFDSPFNGSIDQWDVSNVTDMGYMFHNATAFNQPIGSWDVSKVADMGSMFSSAAAFNQPIDKWNVSKALSMRGMFSGATSFNQVLGRWDVSKVHDVRLMFYKALNFSHLESFSHWSVAPWCVEEVEFFEGKTFRQIQQQLLERQALLRALPKESLNQNKSRTAL